MTATETVTESPLEVVEFSDSMKKPLAEVLPELVNQLGIVYVTSITRTGCSGCETQKPLFEALASKMTLENRSKVKFRRIHVNYQENDRRDSWDSKKTFGHAAYPTYMIHVKSQVGPLEIYRAVYPSMDEIEKQVKENLELSEFYKAEAEKQ